MTGINEAKKSVSGGKAKVAAAIAAKAPAHLIEEERAKLAKYTALKADLQSKFESL